MSGYFLSVEADEDIQTIYLYSEQNWGSQQAKHYLGRLFDLFDLIGHNAEMGRLRPELGQGIRSFRHSSHIVLFMSWRSKSAIIRVLHGSIDIESVFENFDPITSLGDMPQ